jgi:hypothetical protein
MVRPTSWHRFIVGITRFDLMGVVVVVNKRFATPKRKP